MHGGLLLLDDHDLTMLTELYSYPGHKSLMIFWKQELRKKAKQVSKALLLESLIPIHSQLQVCRKKQKSVEPQRHEGTKEDFFSLPGVAQASPEETLCLRVFVVPFFSRTFATTPFKRSSH